MTRLFNDTSDTVWFEGAAENGDRLVLDAVVGDTVFARNADPGDDVSARLPIAPGQQLLITTPMAGISVHLTGETGADDAVYWLPIVFEERKDGVVFVRTVTPGEKTGGRRVHLRPGERLEFRPGAAILALDEIDRFYRELDPERAAGSLAAVLRVWHLTAGIAPPELHYLAQAAAHRLDAATHFLKLAVPVGCSLRDENGPGGPAAIVAVDEYIHLVQESAVALARCIALVENARLRSAFAVERPSGIDRHRHALKDIRDAYEHIDERAVGRIRGEAVADSVTIFDHSQLVRDGTITYRHHRLNVGDLLLLTEECRQVIKALIGGPPPIS